LVLAKVYPGFREVGANGSIRFRTAQSLPAKREKRHQDKTDERRVMVGILCHFLQLLKDKTSLRQYMCRTGLKFAKCVTNLCPKRLRGVRDGRAVVSGSTRKSLRPAGHTRKRAARRSGP
jgi:hypothetical protein